MYQQYFTIIAILTVWLIMVMPAGVVSGQSGMGQEGLAPSGVDSGPIRQGFAPELVIVRTPTMHVHYQIPAASRPYLSRVELWYSRGAKGRWQLYDYDEDRQSPIVFVAPGEGSFRLLVLAVDRWGRRSYQVGDKKVTFDHSIMPPEATEQVAVFIDHTPPRLYLYSPRGEIKDCRSGQIRIRWAGFDHYLQARPVRLYYQRQGSDNWVAISEPLEANGQFDWHFPQRLSGPITIKAEMVDKAGHRDVQLSGVINVTGNMEALSQGRVWMFEPLSGDDPLGDKAKEMGTGQKQQVVSRPMFGMADKRTRAAACFRKGNLHSQRMEWGQAVKAFEEALVNEPSGMAARVNLANVLFKMSKFEEAQEQYELCLQRQPELQTARFGLAQAQIALKQYDKAQKTLAKLLEQDRRDWQAWLMHGDVAAKLGNRELALNSWTQAANDMSPVRRLARQRRTQLER